MLANKRILFIAPKMFDYPEEIARELENLGWLVAFQPDRPIHVVARILRSLSRKGYEKISTRYLNKLLQTAHNVQPDVIFIIGCAIITPSFLQSLRGQHPRAKLITYQWDSNRLYPFFHLLKYFDNAFSFDPLDCKENSKLQYLPLFYLDKYRKLRSIGSENAKYDILHIGSLHVGRYNAILKVEKFCQENDISFKYYLYTPWSSYVKQLFYGKRFRNVQFRKLSPAQIMLMYSESKLILDLPQPQQTGLTMRTFEVLGAGKRLLTTSKYIKNDPVYSTEMITLCNLDNTVLFDVAELKKDIPASKEFFLRMEEYSLREWLKKILGRA